MAVTIKHKQQRSESCMECGKEGTFYVDQDGSAFCRIKCMEDWHGVNFANMKKEV